MNRENTGAKPTAPPRLPPEAEQEILEALFEGMEIHNKTAVAFAYLYDCGPITEPGTYTFKTTYVSTNWPYTEKSISLDFTFEATDNT